MARKHVFQSVLLATGVLLVAACASQPTSTPATTTLLEKKFQQAAGHYQKFRHEGQVVYCKKEKVITSAIPVVQCLSESELRLEVENLERWRNRVSRPVIG
jgi:outer membrane biogenesis lipoprotein LolB